MVELVDFGDCQLKLDFFPRMTIWRLSRVLVSISLLLVVGMDTFSPDDNLMIVTSTRYDLIILLGSGESIASTCLCGCVAMVANLVVCMPKGLLHKFID